LSPFAYAPLSIAAALIGGFAKSDKEASDALARFIKKAAEPVEPA
jgi:hypothetical protein